MPPPPAPPQNTQKRTWSHQKKTEEEKKAERAEKEHQKAEEKERKEKDKEESFWRTFVGILRVLKWLTVLGYDNQATLHNKIMTPEAWHAKDAALKCCGQTFFSPANSLDLSSLSRCFTKIGVKHPSELNKNKLDYYEVSTSMEVVFTTQIIDCWRVFFGTEDLTAYFNNLVAQEKLPVLDCFIKNAQTLVEGYASLMAFEQVLSSKDALLSGVKSETP
ncbi:hypothetical protein Moror_6094 [Moniliophthora roreri MCA 2997]|uniref:DUF6589 domain-containing protein n=1 Tax=Moniliophthora roreri (strain MCA 2997) TaxID=1381753 RepID=V2WVJ4_MONRO|nr:hypothetical protein Moror_6094 [Moniliophthora roreri MCA 2997]